LFETQSIADDQLAALRRDSARLWQNGRDLDFALLADGLEAEREQGITIGVAYRFSSTRRRSFIVAGRAVTNSIPATWRPARQRWSGPYFNGRTRAVVERNQTAFFYLLIAWYSVCSDCEQ
jgi:hypothetical protein